MGLNEPKRLLASSNRVLPAQRGANLRRLGAPAMSQPLGHDREIVTNIPKENDGFRETN
jgi:hypothetical protein